MPAHQRVGRHDGRARTRCLSPEELGLGSETAALVIVQPKGPSTHLLPQDSVLLDEVSEDFGFQASSAAGVIHMVMSTHWTKPASYSDELMTRYVVLYFGCTREFMPRELTRGLPEA